jgi:hypothetical protein
VIEVARHTELVDGERLHGLLHAVERDGLPNEFNRVARRVNRATGRSETKEQNGNNGSGNRDDKPLLINQRKPPAYLSSRQTSSLTLSLTT